MPLLLPVGHWPAQEALGHPQVFQLAKELAQGLILVVEPAQAPQTLSQGRVHRPTHPLAGEQRQSQGCQTFACQHLRIGTGDTHRGEILRASFLLDAGKARFSHSLAPVIVGREPPAGVSSPAIARSSPSTRPASLKPLDLSADDLGCGLGPAKVISQGHHEFKTAKRRVLSLNCRRPPPRQRQPPSLQIPAHGGLRHGRVEAPLHQPPQFRQGNFRMTLHIPGQKPLRLYTQLAMVATSPPIVQPGNSLLLQLPLVTKILPLGERHLESLEVSLHGQPGVAYSLHPLRNNTCTVGGLHAAPSPNSLIPPYKTLVTSKINIYIV